MRILFCSDSFPGRFSVLASSLAARGHEVLFASHYGRRDFALAGVHRVLLKPVREASPLKRAVLAARQARSAFLTLRGSGFSPDIVLFSASSGIPLWVHEVFPNALACGYADCAPRTADFDEEAEQAAMLRQALLSRCHAVFAFSAESHRALPFQLRHSAHVLPAFVDTDFFSPEAARPLDLGGRTFPQSGELVTMDMRPHSESAVEPRAVWELALGLLSHRPASFVLLNCASPELRQQVERLSERLPEAWRARLAVQGYRSLDEWRDRLAASALLVLPEADAAQGVSAEALEALSCATPVAVLSREAGKAADGLRVLCASSERRLFQLCEMLEEVRTRPDLGASLRAHVLKRYAPSLSLAAHIEELEAMHRRHASA